MLLFSEAAFSLRWECTNYVEVTYRVKGLEFEVVGVGSRDDETSRCRIQLFWDLGLGFEI